MEPSVPFFEERLIYIGQLFCIVAAIYMIKVGQIKIGLIFLIGFICQFQVGYIVSNIEYDAEAQGACWATVGSFYKCLPLMHRVSVHLGQIGTILLAFAVFLSAKQLIKTNEKHS